MAIFHITAATSRFTTTGNAFGPPADDTPGADTLIVDPNAFLVANGGITDNGAVLPQTGAWTASINGSIVSRNAYGIFLSPGNAAVSTITIGVEGEVTGGGFAAVFLGSSAKLNNAGTIIGDIGIQISNGGTHVIINSGEITSPLGLAINDSASSNDTVRNSGTINGAVALSGGDDTVTNFGIIAGNISLGNDTNRLTNSGTINGDVFADAGADRVTDFAIVGDVMKSGTITGTVSLGDGNDTFTGGANPESVQDGNGADIVTLGGGNDTYIATGGSAGDGIDIVKGGAGADTYDAAGALAGLNRINLDTAAHDFVIGAFSGTVAANTATGADISGTAKDTIFGFENVNGSPNDDAIFGSAASNVLSGNNGHDFLSGLGGNDTLIGGTGNDDLFGGLGKDQLTGGPDADTFHYTALSESGITAATRDLIADFEQGSDHIDLQLIDANPLPGDQAFDFIGNNTPFTGTAGQLHDFWTAIGQVIEGDVNGDKKADFSIEIKDPTHAITLTNASFSL
jgi:Ca2+-binding RTX toxin-like protein